jgi:tetratricopeptide (TPR) repeat protein
MRSWLMIAALLAAGTAAGTEPATLRVETGVLVEGMQCLVDPSQTYTLYLPRGYTADRRWPALLVFDPRGRSVHAAERFLPAAERWGWVVLSSNDTRSDGPWEPNLKAIQALWPEVHERYAVDERRVYAAGMSGGGHVAYLLGKSTDGLAGVIASGSRLIEDHLQGTSFAMFAAAGDRDFNYQEMRAVDEFVAELGNPHRFESFSGRHEWLPAELAAEAVAWMELAAMQRGLRPRDEAVIDELYARDLAAARELEAEGDLLSALRRYETIVRSFRDLTDVAAPERDAARLEGSREVKRALKEERRWLEYEDATRQRFADAYAWLRHGEEMPTTAELRIALGLRSLEKHAAAAGVEGVTARRLLSALYAEPSYYVGPPLLQAGRWQAAVSALTVATEVYDGWGSAAPTFYNLACALARSGNRRGALEALERAVAEGYRNAAHLRRDPDLESLRGLDGFAAIADALDAGADPSPDSPEG